MELVSPAGGWDQLVAAINGGANAVYLGYKKFGARAYAENFDLPQLKRAVKVSHASGIKIYLTLNTLIKDCELKEIIAFLGEYLSFCQDGIIIHDLGLYKVISDIFPGVRLHASTQLNAHNLETVRLFRKFGFKRVVLARELTLEEIKNISIKEEDIEIEVFVHGSQCYSYSGSCYFSSFTGSRSGNRGKCTQPCRMKYNLYSIEKSSGKNKFILKNSYILSKKDLCGLEVIPYLAFSGIDALKIEGRMKSAEYVGIVTKIYRKYLDLYYKDPQDYKVDSQDIYKLTQIFSREMGTGYFFDSRPRDIISLKKSGSVGNFIGRILKVEHTGKKSNKNAIYIKSSNRISKGDILEIWTNRGNEQVKINHFSAEENKNGNNLYIVETGRGARIGTGDRVFKFFDSELDREAKNLYIDGIILKNGLKNNKIDLTKKIKNAVQIPNILNNLFPTEDILKINACTSDNPKASLAVEVYNLKDALSILDLGADNIILNNFHEVFGNSCRSGKASEKSKGNGSDPLPDSLPGRLDRFKELYSLCNKKKVSFIVKTPAIIHDEDFESLANGAAILVNAGIKNFSVSNLGVLEFLTRNYEGLTLSLDYSLNIFNFQTVSFLNHFINGIRKSILKNTVLSVELTLEEVQGLAENFYSSCCRSNVNTGPGNNRLQCADLYVYSYGFPPVMASRYKMDYLLNDLKDKRNTREYYLIDRKGYRFRIVDDYNSNIIFLGSKKICNLFDLPQFIAGGICNFYIDARTLGLSEIKTVVKFYRNAVDKILDKKMVEFNRIAESAGKNLIFSDYTRGHFYRGIV